MIGWLAIQIALGHRSHEADQKGALAEVAKHSYGLVLLWLLGLGFAAYALWRLGEAAFGTAAEGKKAGPRLQSLVRGIVYGALSVTTFAFIAGHSRQSQARQQASATAKLLRHTYGQWLVAIAGLIFVGVGLFMVWEGLTQRFTRQLRMFDMHGVVRTTVVRLGVVGTISRGVVFALAGVFAVDAAVTVDPAKSTGLDGALRRAKTRIPEG
jgi:hypothetical protein